MRTICTVCRTKVSRKHSSPSGDLHQRIAEAGLKAGDEFRITKVAVQNGKKVTAKVEFEVVSKAVAPAPQAGVVPARSQMTASRNS